MKAEKMVQFTECVRIERYPKEKTAGVRQRPVPIYKKRWVTETEFKELTKPKEKENA